MEVSFVDRPLSTYRFFYSVLFYCFGNFGFLNLMGIRREFQLLILTLIILLIPYIIVRSSNLYKKELFWIVLLYFLGQVMFRMGDQVVTLDALITFISVSFLLLLDEDQSSSILQLIIGFSSIFAAMAIMQAIIVLVEPDLIRYLRVGYTSSTGSEDLIIRHPIALLGFGYNEINLMDFKFVRLTSFASEPSVLIYSFLAPGAIALTYNGWTRILGTLSLFFAIFLSFSGTIYMILSISVIMYYTIRLITKKGFISSILPFLIVAIILIVLLLVPLQQVLDILVSFLEPLARISNVFSKSVSAFERFGGIVKYTLMAPNFLFGAPFLPDIPVSILLGFLYSGGIFLSAIGVAFFYKLFRYSSCLIFTKPFLIGMAAALQYGIFTIVILFSDYGWRSLPGFIILCLIYRRLEQLYNANVTVT